MTLNSSYVERLLLTRADGYPLRERLFVYQLIS